MGLGNLTGQEITRLLAGKNVNVEPMLSPFGEWIKGKSSRDHIEKALQLVNLYFTEPRWDEKILMQKAESMQNMTYNKSPLTVFSDSIRKMCNPVPFDSSIVNYKIVTLNKLRRIHSCLSADPKKFTFVLVGNVKKEEIKPLIEKYLGSIKKSNPTEMIQFKTVVENTSNDLKTGEKRCYFSYPMNNPSASVYLCCQGRIGLTLIDYIYSKIAQDLLINQCLKTIRQVNGGSYTVVQGPEIQGISGFCQLSISFNTNPSTIDKIIVQAKNEFEAFMQGKIDPYEFEKAKTKMIQKYTDYEVTNDWWLNNILFNFYIKGLHELKSNQETTKSTTIEGLTNFIQNLYEQDNIIEVCMVPQ
jgi:zinc protease